jgi:hypothetical protein
VTDAVFLEDLFDAQHFLDLVADQQFVLEDQQDVLAQLDAAQLLLRHDLLAHGGARPGIGFEGHQGVAGDGHCGFHFYSSP